MLNTVFLTTFLLLGCASVNLWIWAVMRFRAGQALLNERKLELPFGFLDVAVMFLFWSFGQVAFSLLGAWLYDIDVQNIAELSASEMSLLTLWNGIGLCVATTAAMLVFVSRYRTFTIFGWQPKFLLKDLIVGLFAFVMVVPWVLLIQSALTQFVPYKHVTQETLKNSGTAFSIFSTWFAAVLAAPICEEIFFRSVLQGYLQRLTQDSAANHEQKMFGGWSKEQRELVVTKYGIGRSELVTDDGLYQKTGNQRPDWRTLWPIFASAFLFAFAHAGQGPAPIPLFFFGLALGYIFYRTGSIVTCIVLHMSLNAFSMFWFTMQVIYPLPATPEVSWLVEAACFNASRWIDAMNLII